MTNKCPTCLEPLVSDSKNYIVTTSCGHLFHTNCVRGWIDRGNKTCPQCRSNISKNKLIRIYLQSTESDIQIPHKTVTNSTIAPSNPKTTQNKVKFGPHCCWMPLKSSKKRKVYCRHFELVHCKYIGYARQVFTTRLQSCMKFWIAC